MSSDSSSPSARDYPRVVLVVLAVVATVLAAVLLPALGSSGLAGSPAQSLFPGDSLSSNNATSGSPGQGTSSTGGLPGAGSVDGSGSGGGAAGGGLGALNPTSSTDIGGSIGTQAFRSQNTTVHLTVQSTAPAYWRTGAYDRYTGSGWERSSPTRSPYDSPLPTGDVRGERVEYEVTLNRSATSLPTVWRPATVSGIDDLAVTEHRALRTAGVLRPGTSFRGTSYRAPREPRVLQATGRSYPAAIEDRYTTLPTDTSPRLVELTDNITADATTPYGEAAAIEKWLEANKGYSLNVSRTSDNIAETFVFEMDEGYCEYFATSMTVMLRTQGIPARYVVGYSTGAEIAPSTYEVRGMNAHAWVEVYFEDIGWVQFDPTPGSERLQQEQQAIQESDTTSDYTPREEGSPGETFTPQDDAQNTTLPTDNQTTNRTASGYDVSLNRTAVPGATVEVTVTREESPVVDEPIFFNGERIGTTDERGTVTGIVPYTNTLQIQIGASSTIETVAPSPDVSTGRVYSRATAVGDGVVQRGNNVTISVETNATVTVSGDPLPGNTVTVIATVRGVPVTDASVVVAGEQVTATGEDGRAAVRLPERSGNVTVAIERGPVNGSTTVSLPTLNVSVAPAGPLALPLAPATVTVTADDTPVSNATVVVTGGETAKTAIDGTASVQLPLASRATVTATAYGLSADATLPGLFTNLGIVVVALVLVVGGPLWLFARRGYRPRRLLGLLAGIPFRIVRYAQLVLITLAARGDDLLVRVLQRIWDSILALADLVRGRVQPGELRDRLVAWLRAQWTTRRSRSEQPPSSPTAATTGEPDPDRLSIRAAWQRFLQRVSVSRPSTRTPGEIARHAIRTDGLPGKPVAALRDAFREVEYGNRAATERAERAERAVDAIEREQETGTDERDERAATDGGTH